MYVSFRAVWPRGVFTVGPFDTFEECEHYLLDDKSHTPTVGAIEESFRGIPVRTWHQVPNQKNPIRKDRS